MRRILLLLVVVCAATALFSHISTASNDNFSMRVDERSTRLFLREKTAEIALAVENLSVQTPAKVKLEILDPENKIVLALELNAKLEKGKNIIKLPFALPDAIKNSKYDLLWHRFHYEISAEKAVPTSGTVSLSEITPEIFEIRVAAADSAFEGSHYRVRLRASHPTTDVGVANVKMKGEVKLNFEDNKNNNDEDDAVKFEKQTVTDADGYAVLDFLIPDGRKVNDGDLKISAEYKGVVREESEDLDFDGENNRPRLYISTDKPLYQPGQMLYVRGLLLDKRKHALADEELQFEIKSPDYETVYKETQKTSGFGVAAISWQIAENTKLGEYQIEVENSDGDRIGYYTVKISRYYLPNFTVAASPDKTFYLAGQNVAEVMVQADYLFGKPVARGKVRVVREISRSWNYHEQKWEIAEAETLEGKFDAEGKFVAKIDLTDLHKNLSDESWQRLKDISFAAYVTDETTNHTEQRRFYVRISKEPIQVYLLGDLYETNPNLPIKFYVSTFYPDGSPAVCDVQISGGLTEHFASAAEKNTARTLQTLFQTKSNGYGAARVEFNLPALAISEDTRKRLNLKILARDASGNVGTLAEDFTLNQKENSLQISANKAIYRRGEAVKVEILSSVKSAFVYVDVVRNWTVIRSDAVRLKNGRGYLTLRYGADFKNDLTIAAYAEVNDGDEYRYDDLIKATTAVIYPNKRELQINLKPSQTVYRPGEDASVNLDVRTAAGKRDQSALGVVVFDKAVEERARTDQEFGGGYSIYGNLYGLLYGNNFGNLTLGDLEKLNARGKIAPDLQLAAEILLRDNRSYYYPEFFGGDAYRVNLNKLFGETLRKELRPTRDALNKIYDQSNRYPSDAQSLKTLLDEAKIDFENLRDAWGNNYRPKFAIERESIVLQFWSAGADKNFDTADDFSPFEQKFNYFAAIGKAIDKVVSKHHQRTNNFILDRDTLRRELKSGDIDLEALRDQYNRPYQIIFDVQGNYYTIRFRSAGENGIAQDYYGSDDFDVWKIQTDYFADSKTKIENVLSEREKQGKAFPRSKEEVQKIFADADINFAGWRDAWENPYYLTFENFSRYADTIKIQSVSQDNGATAQKRQITPVTQQEIAGFKIRSVGTDGKEGTRDDFDAATFFGVIAEQTKFDETSKTVVREISSSGANGAIRGVVKDPNGSVIPNAIITAIEIATSQEYSTTADENGGFLLKNLSSGIYQIKAESPGFKASIIENVPVRSASLTEIEFVLNISGATETVEVSSDEATIVNSTDASFSSTKTTVGAVRLKEQNATPRLREYFPETLLWRPEIITDKKGKAAVKFKLADNITTWKMTVIGSTLDGEVGIAEKEFQSFLPFFADHDPPKILTEGDRIALPIVLRNYLDKPQKVSATMTEANWFRLLSEPTRTLEVAPNESKNAVFSFQTVASVKNGKQRVTAIADEADDAIEKSVSVHPDGREIVATNGTIFNDSVAFDVNFPANALPSTRKAELKIYPNLMAQVVESVEGILQRPDGCGEQTISSTYPSVLILKAAKRGGASNLKATAEKYLKTGYNRLLGYQNPDGSFGYWGDGKADLALTAYAIRFLNDAREFTAVDENVLRRATEYLRAQQRADGSFVKTHEWEKTEDRNQTAILTAYVTRVLATIRNEKDVAGENTLKRALGFLKTRSEEIDEPFMLASYALAAFAASDESVGLKIAEKLRAMAKNENSDAFWELQTNTPFYGWGLAGKIETTALVVQVLAKAETQNMQSADNSSQLLKGLQFLLKQKDRYGVWYSTQATINVLDAIISVMPHGETENTLPGNVEVYLNSVKIKDLALPAPKDISSPITFDLTPFVQNPSNRVELKQTGNNTVSSVSVVQTHYVSWKETDANGFRVNDSDGLRLKVDFDQTNAAIMQEITCHVAAERIGFKGYGMLLAEIGLPPGADVNRESLETAIKNNWSISRYDILPDRVVIYMWASAGGNKFEFKFKPRYGIEAKTAASQIYDYYNPESNAVLAPTKFSIK